MEDDKFRLFAKILKDAGYSLTTARRLVFELLHNSEPMSVHSIHEHLKDQIDRASVYRVINVFEEIGIVQRINIGWKYKLELTDVFNDHHHHISCIGCSKIVAIEEDQQIEKLIEAFSEKYEITAERHQLEIQGYCEKCLAKPSIV
jgi:Fur family ferric uptake transcriptional regulator